MKRYWDTARNKIDNMSLRERAMIFVAAGFVVISLINSILLDPLLAKQQALSTQVIQQQEKMKSLQATIQSLMQSERENENSPLRTNSAQLRQKLLEMDGYLQTRSSRLLEPDKMAGLLKQVLSKNAGLELVALETLPVSLLIDSPQTANAVIGGAGTSSTRQIFKHGVTISVRGSYLKLLRYVSALEKVPTQMFWGEASLSVEKYPDSVLTLTLYTLSLDQVWLTV